MKEDRASYEELERRCREAEARAARLAESERRAEHIRQVLLAIRNVNQLIVAETDRGRLVEKACRNLTATMGYYNAWIALFDEADGTVRDTACSGFNGEFEAVRERLMRGEFTECMRETIGLDELVVVEDPPATCPDCPLSGAYECRAGLTQRLIHGGRLYGILSVSVPGEYADDQEEQDLFSEVAEDIAFALHRLEVDERLHESERRLKEAQETARIGHVEFNVETGRILWADMVYALYERDPAQGPPGYEEVMALHHAEDAARLEAAIREAVETGRPYALDLRVRLPSGREAVHHAIGTPLKDAEGRVTRITGTVQDVSVRKRNEERVRQSEERMDLALRGADLGTWDWHVPSGRLTFNERWAEMLGYGPDEIEPDVSSWEKLVHPDDLPGVSEVLQAHLDGRTEHYETEHRMRHKSGRWIWVLDKGRVIDRDEAGNPLRACGTHLDITEQRRIREVLDRFFELPTNLHLIAGLNGVIHRVNTAWSRSLGYGAEELEGRRFMELVHPDDRKATLEVMGRLGEGETILHFENRYRHKDDGYRLMSWSAVASLDDERVYGVARDITEQRHAEAALSESRARLELALEGGGLGTWEWYPQSGRVVYSDIFARMLGYEPDEIEYRGRFFEAHLHPDDLEGFRAEMDAHVEGRTPLFQGEHRVRTKSGEYLWVMGRGRVMERDADGEVRRVAGVIVDVTDRKRAEEALARSEAMMARTEGIAHVGSWEWDVEHDRVVWSPELFRIFGRDPADGAPSFAEHPDIYLPEDFARLKAAVESTLDRGTSYQLELRGLRPDGTMRHCLAEGHAERDESGRTVRLYGFVQDITERKRAEEALRESEEEHRALFEETASPILVADENGRYMEANRAALNFLECTREELLDKEVWDFAPPGRREAQMQEHAPFTKPRTLETEYFVHGQVKTLLLNVVPLEIRGRRLLYGIGQDITDRKRAEGALRSTLEQQQAVFDTSMVGIMLLHSRVITRVNERMAEMLGYTRGEMEGQGPEQLHLSHENFVEFGEKYYWQLAEKTIVQMEYPLRHKDGHTVWCQFSGRAIAPPDLSRGAVWIIDDITERKRNEEALRESEERFRDILDEVAIVPVQGYDAERRVVYWNAASEKVYGYAREEAMGRRLEDLIIPDGMRDETAAAVDAWVHGGPAIPPGELVLRDKAGRPVPVYSTHIMHASASGEKRMFCVDVNLEPLRRAQDALRESEERLRRIAGVTTDLIYEWDLNSDALMWFGDPDAALGYAPGTIERTIQGWAALFHPDDAERMRRCIETCRTTAEPSRETYRVQRGDGGWTWISDFGTPMLDDDSRPVRWIGGCRDVTREMELEEQHRQSQKMEAVGQLTGGVAHDFNNILQVILGGLDMAMEDLPDDTPAREPLDEVTEAAKRAANLVSQLLAFSRRQIIRPQTLDLNEVVVNLMKMLRRVIGEHIQLEFGPGHDIGAIRADRGMIEQVLMNLCVNARDAMPEGGSIRLETRRVDFDEAFCRRRQWAEPGRYAALSVTDTGCGMDEDVLERAFEPFFTTKEVGKGSGLGLSTVYGIVKQHGGLIDAESEKGKGTTIRVYLPVSDAASVAEGERNAAEAPGGNETILLVEDDDSLRDLTRRLLERGGYTVLSARNGVEAVELFEKRGDDIELALMDIVMPYMGGREAFERMRERRPQLRVLFASGYSEDALGPNFTFETGMQLLQKPFTREGLLHGVREALDA